MFGFARKKTKPRTPLEEFIFTVYGNPPPAKRANVNEAVAMATTELLMGVVDEQVVRLQAEELNATPIPYSTHDLALSVALSFFKKPEYVPHLAMAQLTARLQASEWLPSVLRERWFQLTTLVGTVGWLAVPAMFCSQYGFIGSALGALGYIVTGLILAFALKGAIEASIDP